jgi:hypothetical protein
MTDTTTNPAAVQRHPHEPYIAAVVDAFDANGPIDDYVSSAETADDGTTCTLSAVLSWDDEASPDLYPDGLIVCWDLHRGWEYAGIRPDGSNDVPEDLLLPLWAAPEEVAAAVRALLAGEDPPFVALPDWHDDAVKAAVKAWEASE